MRYSQMDAEQRRLLDDPESFPMRVRFLGKTGTLAFLEVQFLREKGVDFEIGPPEEDGDLFAAAGRLVVGGLGLFVLLARAVRVLPGRRKG